LEVFQVFVSVIRAQVRVLLVLLLLAGTATLVPANGAASSAPMRATACGSLIHTRELVEPPDVDLWKMPLDANGEHELILSVHKDGDRYCYVWNGAVQAIAPTIRTMRGEHFAIRIVNDLDGPSRGERVPSTAIPPCMPMHMPPSDLQHHVGYLNHTIDDLWMKHGGNDTNLHLHGFEGPPSDEDVFLSSLSTPMHACEYRVTVPRSQPPGTYMYHTHAHGSSGDQVAAGLDGAWIVEPDRPQIADTAEHVIMLRYRIPNVLQNSYAPDETPIAFAAIAHEAARPVASSIPYDPFAPPPWPVSYPVSAGGVALDPSGCNGASSDVRIALNGSDAPATLHIPAGTTQLLRIVNATSDSAARLFLRDAAGHRVPFEVVGLDGVPVSGNLAHPLAQYLSMNELMLTTMSRADILFTAVAGTSYSLSSEHFCAGKDFFFQQHEDLLQITGVPTAGAAITVNSTPIQAADTPAAKLVAYARAHPTLVRRRAITFTEYLFGQHGKVPIHDGYYITDTTSANFREHPFWPAYASASAFPSKADIVVKRGSVEEWYLINATMESHAFHIHQMTFVQENDGSGVPVTADTVLVRVGSLLPNKRDPNYPLVKPRITKILLDFRNVPRGTFVFHCHMLFHEDRGMMAIIKVV
jgi:suppressor of ftsI